MQTIRIKKRIWKILRNHHNAIPLFLYCIEQTESGINHIYWSDNEKFCEHMGVTYDELYAARDFLLENNIIRQNGERSIEQQQKSRDAAREICIKRGWPISNKPLKPVPLYKVVEDVYDWGIN